MRRRARRGFRHLALKALAPACVLAVLAECAGTASAQASGNVAVVSDYRYRGTSLSDGLPALQASFAYDHVSGAYGGLFGSTARLSDSDRGSVHATAYGGYAAPVDFARSWDGGVQLSGIAGRREYAYAELYAGVSWEHASGHLHWAPRYFGMPRQTLYAELDASRELGTDVQLSIHVGALWPFARSPGEYTVAQRPTFDVRASAGTRIHGIGVELWWSDRYGSDAPYTPGYPGRRSVVGATLSHAL